MVMDSFCYVEPILIGWTHVMNTKKHCTDCKKIKEFKECLLVNPVKAKKWKKKVWKKMHPNHLSGSGILKTTSVKLRFLQIDAFSPSYDLVYVIW